MQELWKDIKGYEGKYQVSNFGRVKSLNYNNTSQEKILVNSLSNKGYYRVSLSLNNKAKQYNIHRLVAEAFIPNPLNLPFVNHKDKNRTNNMVDNLEWCTIQYNNTYGTVLDRLSNVRSKEVICIETQKIYKSAKQVEIETGLSASSIGKCCRGQRKTCGGFHWKFTKDNV